MTPQEKLAQQVALLEALSVVDAQIKRLDVQIGEEQSSLESLKKELGFLDNKLTADRGTVDEMHRAVNELTIEARQMGSQIDRSREKLGRARNERESVAAEREMDELRKLLRDREEEVGKLNSLGDNAKRTITEMQTQRDKIWAELSSSESSISARIAEVSAERERKIAERSEISKKVVPISLRRYEAVRKKRGSGIARVDSEGTCRACHISLAPQLFQKLLRREQLEECPSCHRIIYWAADPPRPGEEPEA